MPQKYKGSSETTKATICANEIDNLKEMDTFLEGTISKN